MKFRKTLLASLILGLFSFANAKIFEATGYGDTPDAAKKDAVTNAVKFSIGEYVVNREELNNESFNQSIVSHSNAYVKSIAVKSQKKDGAQYVVDVAVDIESQKLIDAIKSQQTATANNVVGKELLSQFSDHLDKKSVNDNSLKDFENLVNELLVKPYFEAKNPPVSIEIIGKLRSGKIIDEKYDRFPVVLSIRLKSNDSYIRAIRRIFKESENADGIHIRTSIHVIKNGESRDFEQGDLYEADIDKVNILSRVMSELNPDSVLRQYYRDSRPYLTFVLLDNNGDVIKEVLADDDYHTANNLVHNKSYNRDKESTYIENFDEIGQRGSMILSSLFSEREYWGFFDDRMLNLNNVDMILDHVIYVTKSELEELKDIKVMFK